MLRKAVPDQFSQLELTIMNDAFYRQKQAWHVIIFARRSPEDE